MRFLRYGGTLYEQLRRRPGETMFSKSDFAVGARKVFEYLSQYGFTETSAEDWKIVYSSDDGWTISITFATFQFELDLYIGHNEKRYSLSDFLYADDPDQFSRFHAVRASNERELTASLQLLSNQLQEFGARALAKDPEVMAFVEAGLKVYADRRRQGLTY